MKKIITKFEKLELAFKALENIYQKEVAEDRQTIDATIQRFEFTFELCWKFLKEYFALDGIEINSPREALRQAYASKIIHDEKIWIAMLKDRNLTSHTYDKELADLVFKDIKMYVPLFRDLIDYVKGDLLPKAISKTDETL